MKYTAGMEMDYRCTRCKLVLAHTVLAAVKGIPVQLRCNTCMTDRKYRKPTTASKRSTTRRAAAKEPARETAGELSVKRKQDTDGAAQSAWSAKLESARSAGAESLKYDTKQDHPIGSLVKHPKFGVGLSERTLNPQRVVVLFEDGERMLVQNRV